MEKLDCLVWAAGISFISFGMRIGVRVSTPELLEKVLAYLPPGWKFAPSPRVERLYSLVAGGVGPQPNVRKFHLLYGNSQRLARFASPDGLLETFETDLNSSIAEGSRQWFFLHAGVIGWKGQAVLIPGRSFSGKTTLVKEFLRMGADYYSDEFAPLGGSGRVHPFPRLLSIREHGSQGQMRVAAEDVGRQERRKTDSGQALTLDTVQARYEVAPESDVSREGISRVAGKRVCGTTPARARPGHCGKVGLPSPNSHGLPW